MVTALGRAALSFISYIGELAILVYETFRAMIVAPIRWRLLSDQIVEVGWRSQFVVIVTGMFTGAVLPLLVAESIGLGICASYFVGVHVLGISGPFFLENLYRYLGARDIKMALCKAFCLGVVIAFVSCHQGLNAKDGAVGVGRAPTEAVVISSLAILVLNFFLTLLLNAIFPYGQ